MINEASSTNKQNKRKRSDNNQHLTTAAEAGAPSPCYSSLEKPFKTGRFEESLSLSDPVFGLPYSTMSAGASVLDNGLQNMSSSPVFLATALSHMNDAIEMIPNENKMAFLEAKRMASVLVKAESDPVKFLRSRDFNPWTSARCLVEHWEHRKKWFASRWLLPLMDITGAGALDDADLQLLLRTRWLTLIKPKDANQGRYFIVNQTDDADFAIEQRMRVSFYLGCKAADFAGQAVGVTVIRLIADKDPVFSVPRFNIAKLAFYMYKEALPIRFRHVFLLNRKESQSGRIMAFCVKRVGSFLCNLFEGGEHAPFIIYVCRMSEVAQALHPMGVDADVLPVNHGVRGPMIDNSNRNESKMDKTKVIDSLKSHGCRRRQHRRQSRALGQVAMMMMIKSEK